MVAAIDRCYYVTRRGDVSDFRDRLHRPCKRALAFFNSSKLNSFVRCREHRPSSIRASLIIARWNAAFRSNPLHPTSPRDNSPRFELQILLNPATEGEPWRNLGYRAFVPRLEGSRLLKCASSHVFEHMAGRVRRWEILFRFVNRETLVERRSKVSIF